MFVIWLDFVELLYSMKESNPNDEPNLKKLSKVYRAFASKACRKSIMIGEALPLETMSRIISNLSQLNQPWVIIFPVVIILELPSWKTNNKIAKNNLINIISSFQLSSIKMKIDSLFHCKGASLEIVESMARDRFFLQKKSKRSVKDEEIESADSDKEISDYQSCDDDVASNVSDGEDAKESSGQKRLRLAKEYLERLQATKDDFFVGAKQEDHEILSARLKSDQMEQEGRLFRDQISRIGPVEVSKATLLKGHSKCVTAVSFPSQGTHLYTASKDGSIIKWDTKTLKKIHTFERVKKTSRKGQSQAYYHSDAIYSLAVSSDSKFLASGGKDRMINIYSVDSNELVRSFFHHKDSITGLVFRKGQQNELFSSSKDRSVRLWKVDNMTYVESLFGHQEGILDLDSLMKERCISVGGRDRSLHLFKVLDQAQLVFRIDDGKYGSLNCCKMIDEEHFVCSTECGALLIFSISKRKPILHYVMRMMTIELFAVLAKLYFQMLLLLVLQMETYVSGKWMKEKIL